ncbi:MAG: hypothetical protein GXY48_04060 [Methanomicrobiales archaeon]|nr:hypothetical protein [Methanomicrobiales archaeon]
MQYEHRKYPLHPFDFFSDLLCIFSNQISHLVIEFESSIDQEILKKATEIATIAEPVTRCRVKRDIDMLWWDEIPEIRSDELVKCLSSPEPISVLHDALSTTIDPYQGPLIRLVLIKSADQKRGDILVVNVHHISMDGRGLKDMVNLILNQYRLIQSEETEKLIPTSLKQRELPRVSSLINQENRITSPPESTISWSDDFTIPYLSLMSDRQSYSVLHLQPERTKLIHEIRKEWNVTINDLMLATIARACAQMTDKNEDMEISLLNTVDLRRYLPHNSVRSVHNFSTAFVVEILVRKDESLRDTAMHVKTVVDAIKRGKPGLDGALEAERLYAEGHCAAKKEIEKRWEENITSGKRIPLFSNTGIIDGELINAVIPVHDAYILPNHSLAPAFFFALSNFNDRITISAAYYKPAFDIIAIERLFNEIDQTIPGYSTYPGIYSVI